jgi:hypothetical protein
MGKLNDLDYDGYLSLEYEGNPEDPMPEVIECLQVINRVIDGL